MTNAELIKAQAAEIERLRGDLAKAVEALRFYAWENEMRLPSEGPWGAGSTDFGTVARATLAELTGGAAVKDSLTTENEKQSHEWKCPIDYPGCRKNCGSQYGCKN